MKAAPVPGWRATPSDLGVPPPVGTEPARFADRVSSDGDRAYFIVGRPDAGTTQWWLTALDASTGRRLFDAVALNTGEYRPQCFLNGPAAVLCVDHQQSGSVAWVVDVPSGKVSYSGPTDLFNVAYDIEQVGRYAVAQASEKGVYGIGPQAQTTWFVPGGGLWQTNPWGDVGALPLATQTAPGRGSDKHVVFRVSDGTVITPQLPEGTSQGSAAVFPGGFAIALLRDDGPDRGVRFFDEDGNPTGESDAWVYLTEGAVAVPTAESPTGEGTDRDLLAFAPDGSILVGRRCGGRRCGGRWVHHRITSNP
jgi:hypothetical protein